MIALIHTYQLLVLRNQSAPLAVKATCKEDACQMIKLSFSGQEYGLVEIDMARDLQETWLLMRMTPFEYCKFLHIESWDGRRFRSFGKAQIGTDIITAVQLCEPEYFVQPGVARIDAVYASA